MAIDKNKIKNYVTPHDKGNGSGGVTYIHGAVSNGELPADLNVTSITAAKGDINILNGNTLGFDDGQFIYLGAQNGQITKISGSELNYEIGQINTLTSDKIKTGYLEADEISATKAWLETLNSRYITTEYLTVTKQAHFFELIIDKVRSVGGSLIMTQAQCVADYVKPVDADGETVTTVDGQTVHTPNGNYLPKILVPDDPNDPNGPKHYEEDLTNPLALSFDVFFLAKDDETQRENKNEWVIGDQAYCQSFGNVSGAGVYYDVSNKYYWRKVTSILSDRYMNVRTGEELPLSASAQASVNSVTIEFPYIVTLDENDNEAEIATGWNVTTQNIVPGVTWTADSSITDGRTKGTMTTVNTVFGIQMTPTANSSLANATPVKFGINCTDPARLNIGIYYNDGSSNWFPAPERATDSYEYNLTTSAQVEAVVITNADEVEWKLVHGIRLSNVDYDQTLVQNTESVPTIGDNITQLGYRYDDVSSGAGDDKPRASAIIIAAYQTPDKGETYNGKTYRGLTPPSYAQYKLINDYHLSRHRHTFFDALGSEFYGEFYAGTGTDISQYQPVDSQAYHLFIAYAQNDGQGHADPNNWTKEPQGGVSYEFMGFSSRAITLEPGETEDDAIDRIEDSLVFDRYDWSMVPGGTGTPGGHWVNAYKNTQSKTTAPNPPNVNGVPKTLSQLPYDDWYETPQTLQDGEYTWMTQAFIDGNGNMQLWQTAIRLTGADGTPGTDGNEIEFIYTRNNGDADGDPETPPAPRPGYGPGQSGSYPDDWPHIGNVDHQTITNADGSTTTWYDNPQGVGDYPNDPNAYRYEYVSQRIKRDGSWGDYSSPVVWSSWGRKGQDGDGYEYIYGRNDSTTTPPEITYTPNRNKTRDDDDFVPIGWEDDPQGVTSNTNERCEWVAVRKKQNGNPWGNFSTPALWAQYVPPGSTGRNGEFTQFIYRNGATAESVAIPEAEQQQASIPTNWSASATTPATGEFTWCSNRVVSYSVSNVANYARWETPYRITGDNGQPGEDGDFTEFIYTRNNTGVAPSAPPHGTYARDWPNDGTTDHKTVNGVTWYDNPQGVTSSMMWEYVSSRQYNGSTQTWSDYSTPAVWAKWGEKGQDGDGYEYIFTNTWNTTLYPDAPPAPPHGTYADDWHGTDSNGTVWDDDPVGVSVDKKKEFVSMRKKSGNSGWSDYSTPTLWSQFVPRGVNGQNGQYTQFIYRNNATAPTIPENQQQQATIPTNWSASATTPATGEFTWCSNRVVTYDVNNNPSYGRWETPYRITGDKGEQGADGDLIEFIYTTNNTGVAPAAPTGTDYPRDWPNDETTDHQTVNGVTWYDNPQGVSANNRFEYVSSREYDGVNETWSTYSTPALWSKYGENGRDGDGYEYIYCLTATENDVPELWQTYSEFTANKGSYKGNYKYTNVEFNGSSSNSKILRWKGGTKNNNYSDTSTWHDASEDEYLPPNEKLGHVTTASSGNPVSTWTDDPQGVSINYKAEWVAVRKKENEVWGDFSTPTIWAMYGGTGPQGPQGPQGNNGINGSGYKLVDVGSIAYYEVGLDSSNNVTKSLHISLKYKVAKIVGTTVQYLSTSELDSLPLRPYVMISKSTTTSSPTYKYCPFMYESSTASVAICTYTFEPTNQTYLETYIMNNTKTNLPIVLVPRKPTDEYDTFNINDTILGQIQDQTSVPVVMGSNAELKIVKGDGTNGPSIKALVTGQQGINQNITTLTLDVQGIQGQVSSLNTEMAGKVDQSTLTQTANQIRSEVVQIYNDANGYPKQTLTTVDLRSLSTTKFYPVAVSLPYYQGGSGTGKTPRVSIRVSRLIDVNYGGPDYSTHHVGNDKSAALDGFPFTLEFSTMPCGWGNVWSIDPNKPNFNEPIFVNKVEISYTQDINGIPANYIVPAIYQNYMGSKISDAGNDEIIYLRGGSKYDVESSWAGSTITLYSDDTGYYWSNGSDSFQMTPMDYDVNIGPVLQDEMSRSEIVQTANQIQLNVYNQLREKTGINVETGTITLDANNTIFNGSIKMYNAQDGLVIFNDSGQKAVEVVKDSIGTFGTNQNTTNHLSASTYTCTYIVGNNGGYRMYIDQFNTSAEDNYGGYTTETSYYGQTQYLPAVLRLGRHNNGETLSIRNVEWTMEGSYSGVRTDYKVRARLYWLNSDHIITSWQNTWSTPNYSNGKFKITLPDYTVTSTGSGYEWTLLLDFKGPNPSNNRSKSYKFNVTADLVSNMSINTKIGTDGYRTVTPTSETWVNQNQITNLFFGSDTNMYGSNYKLFGTSVDKYGTNNVFGSATIDGTTPMSSPSYINVGCIGPLLKIKGNTTSDNDTNRINGAIGWESFSYNPILPRIIVKHYGVHIIPKYILIEGRHPSYSSNWHLIMLNNGTSESDYLPIGTEVYIINQCGGDNIYATGYNASGTANLPKCIYGDNTTEAYKGIQIKNGWVASFVHLGGGYWKYLQHYVNDGSDGTNF